VRPNENCYINLCVSLEWREQTDELVFCQFGAGSIAKKRMEKGWDEQMNA